MGKVEENRFYGRVVIPKVVSTDGPNAPMRYGRIGFELVDRYGNVREVHGLGDVKLDMAGGEEIVVATIQMAVDVRLADDDE